MSKHTPFYSLQRALGAQFEDRIGFQAAVVYSDAREEHACVRERVGLFDVYYQVAVEIGGRHAQELLARVLVNDVRRMVDGSVMYSSILNDQGGIVDDLTCFRFSENRFWLCPTPSRVTAVMEALGLESARLEAAVTNLGYKNAYLSLQGPRSRELLSSLTTVDLSTARLPYYHFSCGSLLDVPDVVISRTGYSGELGYEVFFPVEYAAHVWESLLSAGAKFGIQPCGLRALRSLRGEKRYLLYGLDIDTQTDPLSAGLGWTVRFDDRNFVGRPALEEIRRRGGPDRELRLLDCGGFHPVARGDRIYREGRAVGTVTSTESGHTVGRTLAFASLQREALSQGAALEIEYACDGVPTRLPAAMLTAAPYDPERKRLTV